MSKTVFLFPGQGAQSVGMGKDFYDEFQIAKDTYHKADEILKYSISQLCFEGPNEELTQTINSQPAIYTTSWVIWEVLKSLGKISVSSESQFAGLSLGEFSAHSACGTWQFEDGLRLVQKRAEAMQKAAESTDGTMASVLNLDVNTIDEICKNIDGIVQSANYNISSQIVISGETAAVEEASKKLLEAGAKRVIPLSVSGAFHSPLMASAESALSEAFDSVSLSETESKVYSNVSASAVTNVEDVKETVVGQLTSPVRWYQTMEKLIDLGYTNFIELGPNKVLTGLMRRINKEIKVINIKEVTDLEKLN
ncbi:MAG: [acyl-carrier-protein] S-malonyltransferase [Planctomycetota bacterium]|nr:MAG: [acyl-carrier-protein] S-malonyltransferase [Planctomycetota bacterium]